MSTGQAIPTSCVPGNTSQAETPKHRVLAWLHNLPVDLSEFANIAENVGGRAESLPTTSTPRSAAASTEARQQPRVCSSSSATAETDAETPATSVGSAESAPRCTSPGPAQATTVNRTSKGPGHPHRRAGEWSTPISGTTQQTDALHRTRKGLGHPHRQAGDWSTSVPAATRLQDDDDSSNPATAPRPDARNEAYQALCGAVRT